MEALETRLDKLNAAIGDAERMNAIDPRWRMYARTSLNEVRYLLRLLEPAISVSETLADITGNKELEAAVNDLVRSLDELREVIPQLHKLIGKGRQLPPAHVKDKLLTLLRKAEDSIAKRIVPILSMADSANATSKALVGITLEEYRDIEQLMAERPGLVGKVREMWNEDEDHDGEWSNLVLRDLARWVAEVDTNEPEALNRSDVELAEDFIDGMAVDRFHASGEETIPWAQVKAELGL